MNEREKQGLLKLAWIANLTPENCPGGLPGSDREWRRLVNRIVLEVKQVVAEVSDRSDKSHKTDGPRLIPTHGGYRRLRSFQVASLVYDASVMFCDRFVPKRSRTHDQMVQAARSGRQNIAEGSMASATSKKTELKLTNVAKASLEELLLDYEDFLRQNNLRLWAKDSPEARAVRQRFRESDGSDKSDLSDPSDRPDPCGLADASAEVAANTLLCLINQAIYLLKRQIAFQEKTFLDQGGFTERLYHVRSARRNRRSGGQP